LITPLLTGCRITYFPVSYRKDVLLDVLKTASVTVLPAVPQYYNILHSDMFERFAGLPGPLRSCVVRLSGIFIRRKLGQQLRLLVSGGARLEEQIEKDFSKAGFVFTEGYGLTETSPIVTFEPPENPRPGSVGIAIPDVEIRVHEPDDSGEGEVCVKGESVMKGYYKDQDATREVIRDGWFHTGDLGRIDDDGYLFLTGRKKEVIVLGSGKNIYPSEVEEHYLQSDYIKEICVLENPVEGRGKGKLTALIIPDMEYIRQRNEKNIREKVYWSVGELSRTLPEYERIHGFQISSEPLPRTTLGKVKRHEVRERFKSEKKPRDREKNRTFPEDDEDIRDKETAGKIMDILSRKSGTRVDLSDHLEIDLGIDSLERVQLAMELEKELGAKLPDEIFYENDTVKKLIMALTGYLQQAGDEGRPEKGWKEILKEKPPEHELEKLYLDPSPVNVILTRIFVRSFYYIFKRIWGLDIKGRENIPSRGPYLICPNHNSYLDGLVITGCLPVKAARDMFFLVYRQILQKPAFSWSPYFARLVPIDPEADFITTMRIVSYLMEKEKAVCFFPEGNRSFDGELQEFKKGVGIMMKELDVPVVPAYIKGTFESWPSGRRFPRPHPLEVNFGKPVKWDDVVGKGRKEDKDEYAAVAEGLWAKVKELQNSGGK
ncbi:MAG: AMP-binding protein, partial [Candidatus Omnitrophica bacterium]|nr:AMP-binding protein [Candidatus Omnitrophota bacterium]